MKRKRTVLITGSEGYLGRALMKAFRKSGDDVYGMDIVGDRCLEHDLNFEFNWNIEWDVVVCNAKTGGWRGHQSLAKKARECIVNIGSIYGVLGNDPSMYKGTEIEPTPDWYAASKGALISLTRWQATNLAPVRANCVCPGGILRNHSARFRKRYEAKVPLKRMATEQDIVGPIVFLCSKEASYITGQVLMVDGGLSSW